MRPLRILIPAFLLFSLAAVAQQSKVADILRSVHS